MSAIIKLPGKYIGLKQSRRLNTVTGYTILSLIAREILLPTDRSPRIWGKVRARKVSIRTAHRTAFSLVFMCGTPSSDALTRPSDAEGV